MKDFANYHINIINSYILKYDYKSYLEIGIDEGICFMQISCQYKIGVDPNSESHCVTHKMTSDEFFLQNRKTFDLIFIDGLHHSEQVTKDIENAIKFLNNGGTIIVHDCLPKDEIEQIIPRQTKVWTGDVWKSWVKFRNRPDLRMHVFDVDYGIGIIQKGSQIPFYIEDKDLTWENFQKNKEIWLNLVSYA
jgi:hypothetical protein